MSKSGATHLKSLAVANRKVGKHLPGARSVEFTPAKGGLVSKTRGENADGSYAEPIQGIHPSLSHAVQHLKTTLGHVYDQEDGSKGGGD